MSAMRARTALALAGAAALLLPIAGQARVQDTVVIKVTSVTAKGSPVTKDKPPKGASNGDTVTFKDDLLNAAAQFGKKVGAKVGTDQGTMTFSSKTSARFTGFATLPGGTVTLDGAVASASDGKSIIIPVTGGTGRYRNAHGTLLVGPGNKRALNTYTLVVPTTPVA
jgi:hypothetical protein